jgi:hypothetical protein
MHTLKRISRILTAFILAMMLLPWGSGGLSRTAGAACPVTAENWQEVGADSACAGDISDNSGASWVSSVAVAPDGTPYIAWDDNSSEDCEIYVRRWNGNSWKEVGAGSASDGLCAPTARASATWRASRWTRTTSRVRESRRQKAGAGSGWERPA